MKIFKKIILSSLFSVVLCGAGFSKEALDEKFRVEMNLSDFAFFGITAGNTTDFSVDLTWLNNQIGARFGIMARESWLLGDSIQNVDFSWNPYAGITFANGCLMGGAIPYFNNDGTVSWSPYVGFNWDFDVIPVKPGLSNSLAIRAGIDYYISNQRSTDTAGQIAGVLLSAIIPKVYVGLTYKLGKGFPKTIPADPIANVPQDVVTD